MAKASQALNIQDLRDMAKERLTRGLFDLIDKGSEDDICLRHNRDALDQIKLRSRVLNDTSSRNPASTMFGKPVAMPLLIGPTGPAGFVWYRGEIELARAAARMGVPFVLANTAASPMEEVLAQGGGRQFAQMYVWNDAEASLRYVHRAREAGLEALVFTVDGTVPYNRETDTRNGATMPMRVTRRNVVDLARHPRWLFGTMGRYLLKERRLPRFVNISLPDGLSPLQAAGFWRKNDALDMNFFRRIRDMWPRTLIVKGILHAEDARMVVDAGADGVIVSNHGGIANDSAPAAIDVLPSIAKEVADRATVIVDGGIRRGSDILKCLGLEAHAVAVGRATLYGVAAAGEDGAYRALEILHAELRRTMGVLSVSRTEQLSRDHLVIPPGSLIHAI